MTIQKTALADVLVCALATLCIGSAHAKISQADADRLGRDLTPVGGEVAGNKDGSIPKYDGGLTKPPACFKPGVEYCDPFASDKSTLTISAANADQYKDKLMPGALAMLKAYNTFKMPVYQTRRTAAIPADVAAVVKAEATKIELNGFAMANRIASTTPFPIPKTGVEAIWNHNVRFLGGGIIKETSMFPVRPNGDFTRTTLKETRIFNQNMDNPQENKLLFFHAYYKFPPTLTGTIYLVHEPVDQMKEQRSAWIYNSGARRVKRAPDLAYDAINDGTEGVSTTDQFDGYNGAPDRYEWKLVGKKEMYIPYNTYKVGEKKVKFSEIVTPRHANPDLLRYELHRVWQVEATLKAGQKHIYGKRVFLLDEDSWQVVWEDVYDTRGQLWKVGMHGFVQYYDAMVPWTRYNSIHDLLSGMYIIDGLDNEMSGTIQFGAKGKMVDFQSDALRRAGK
jgi:hypothetical protein